MERRSSQRISHKLKAEIVFKNKSYDGYIENFSREGIFKIMILEKRLTEFFPGVVLKINFNDHSGEIFSIKGEVKWLRIKSEPSQGMKYSMGMEIINPPQAYKEFVESLFKKSSP
jgi:hypothetical protein